MDESYSMDGQPEIWAKAVAMGLLEIAIAQKRDFAAIHFSGDSNPNNLHVDYFYKEQPYNIEKILAFCEYFDGGRKLTAVLQSNLQDNHRAKSVELLRDKDNTEVTRKQLVP